MVALNSERLPYYWPMWPALGMVIMVLAAVLFQDSPGRREVRQRQRELGREDRDRRRHDRRGRPGPE